MNTKHNTRLLLFAFVCSLLAAPAKAGDDESLQNRALKRFYSELGTLFRKHYPKATSHLLKDTIHFEHDTRVFIVHEAQMTGEWQDPWETRGPKPGGILCDIRFSPVSGQTDPTLFSVQKLEGAWSNLKELSGQRRAVSTSTNSFGIYL